MDPLAIVGTAIVILGAISPIIIKYYGKVEKLLVVIQMFLNLYKTFLETGLASSDGGATRTEAEYAKLGRDFEALAITVDSAVDVDAWITPKA